jgi:hypothetical protein
MWRVIARLPLDAHTHRAYAGPAVREILGPVEEWRLVEAEVAAAVEAVLSEGTAT